MTKNFCSNFVRIPFSVMYLYVCVNVSNQTLYGKTEMKQFKHFLFDTIFQNFIIFFLKKGDAIFL